MRGSTGNWLGGFVQETGLAAYRAVARLAAAQLANIPQVRSVLLTGSLTRPHRAVPGASDIDLVLACDLESLRDEEALRRRLLTWQRTAARFGPLFYNLDYLDVRELPYVRAFGNAWAIRLNESGRTLIGPDLLRPKAQRPEIEIRFEHLSFALRRWSNTGARLLDPTLRLRPGVRLRTATRLITDLAELWLAPEETLHTTELLQRAAAARPSSSALAELASSRQKTEADVASHFLPASLEIVDAFAGELAASCQSDFHVRGRVDRFSPPAELVELKALLPAPFSSVLLLRRGPYAQEYLPVALAQPGAAPEAVVAQATRRLGSVGPALSRLARWSRRPVPFTRNLWAAAVALDPAPFGGAAATSPLWVAGEQPEPPRSPPADVIAAILRARAVEAFVLLRSLELRARRSTEHRYRAVAGQMALMDAVERAGTDELLDVSWNRGRSPLPAPSQRLSRLRSFSEKTRLELDPLLADRLR